MVQPVGSSLKPIPLTSSDIIPNRSARVGVAGLGLFALGGFVNQGLMYGGLVLMLLALSGQGGRFLELAGRMAFFRISALLTGYILVSGLLGYLRSGDEWRPEVLESALDLLLAGGIFAPVAAYWLGGDGRRVRWVLGLGLAGLVYALLTGFHWERLDAVMGGARDLFGMGNGAALFAATGLTGLLILVASGRLRSWWLELSALVLLGCLAVVVLWTQTRAVWLACALVLPLVMIAMTLHAWKYHDNRRAIALLLVVAGLLVAAVVSTSQVLERRLSGEGAAFMALLSDETGDYGNSGLRHRLPLWRDALERVRERPVLGWGAGTSDILISTSEIGHRSSLTHYHNLYLQLQVELGSVGLILFLVWIGTALKTAGTGARNVREAFPVVVFLFAAIALFLLAGLFQIRHDDERGHYLLILFGALAAHRAMFSGASVRAERKPDQ